jgi:flagellar biosynthetic protein FlhB
MADGGTGEKTEEPTPERLRKLRKEGNVAKSQDVITALSFLVVFCIIAGVFPFLGEQIIGFFNFSVVASLRIAEETEVVVPAVLYQSMVTMGLMIVPACMGALILGVVCNVAQVGFMFTLKPITPDFNRLNPVNGIKNLVNKKKLVELLKTSLKFIVISYLSWVALHDAMREVVLIVRSDLNVGMGIIGGIIWEFCTKIGGVFIVIAAFDAFYQHKRYIKENMMSKYDVKQEYKQSEGDPHHKAARRQFHQEILHSAAPAAVKNADVVVRNPEHIAVALKYDKEKKAGAPQVVAKGERLWADQIIEAAKKYGIPIVRNVPLAQALNKLDVGDDIPEELYEAVAEILNFVFQLSEDQKAKARGGKPAAAKPEKQAPAKGELPAKKGR